MMAKTNDKGLSIKGQFTNAYFYSVFALYGLLYLKFTVLLIIGKMEWCFCVWEKKRLSTPPSSKLIKE